MLIIRDSYLDGIELKFGVPRADRGVAKTTYPAITPHSASQRKRLIILGSF